MFEGIINFFKKFAKSEEENAKSKDTAKERLHLVLMQDRANVSADFLEMMKQEIIEVIKKYIEVDEKEIDVKLTNKTNDDGSMGAPALYANIPITNIKNENKSKEEKIEATEKVDDIVEIKDKEEKKSKEKSSNDDSKNEEIVKKQEENSNKTNQSKEDSLNKNEKDSKLSQKEEEIKESTQNKKTEKAKGNKSAKPVTSKKNKNKK